MNSSKQKKVRYAYKDDLRIVFPVLRITDKNGFIADAFVQINNTAYENTEGSQKKMKKDSNGVLLLGIGGVVLVGAIILVTIKYRKYKGAQR